jgi:hypothetical protein
VGRERLDRERLLRRTKAEIVDEAEAALDENDKEHARRLRLQAGSLRNLLAGRDYADEMEALHQRMADLERRLQAAQEELRRLRGQDIADSWAGAV